MTRFTMPCARATKYSTLCRKLLRSKPHTRDRISTFTDLRIELAAHAATEERYLYVPILMDDTGLSPGTVAAAMDIKHFTYLLYAVALL